ncbi:MAG: hypothetical protein IJ329_03490 [Clostridia bacterium]|nr:hypothetical protein [Clostridia bacterium]
MKKQKKTSGRFVSEKAIKKKLQVKSFEDLPLDKYDDLAELLVKTKKDVAIGIINQLPEYTVYAKEMLGKLTSLCQTALDEGKNVHDNVVQGYMIVLNGLKNELETKRLSSRKKKKITMQMMEVAEKIAKEGTEHRNFVLNTLKAFGLIGTAIATVAVSVAVITKNTLTKK